MNIEARITETRTLTVDAIRVTVPVRYDDEDIPDDFPGRTGKTLCLTLDLDTRKVRDWPVDRHDAVVAALALCENGSSDPTGRALVHMKVCDQGRYELLSGAETVATLSDCYVPGLLPGDHYGDYLILDIEADGTIRDWTPRPDKVAERFFDGEE